MWSALETRIGFALHLVVGLKRRPDRRRHASSSNAASSSRFRPILLKPEDLAPWYLDQRTANWKALRHRGNTVGSQHKTNPNVNPVSSTPRKHTVERSLHTAEKAKVAPWIPHQICHFVATEFRHAPGIEVAQHLLGRTRSAVTSLYAKAKEKKAIKAARYAPKLR